MQCCKCGEIYYRNVTHKHNVPRAKQSVSSIMLQESFLFQTQERWSAVVLSVQKQKRKSRRRWCIWCNVLNRNFVKSVQSQNSGRLKRDLSGCSGQMPEQTSTCKLCILGGTRMITVSYAVRFWWFCWWLPIRILKSHYNIYFSFFLVSRCLFSSFCLRPCLLLQTGNSCWQSIDHNKELYFQRQIFFTK